MVPDSSMLASELASELAAVPEAVRAQTTARSEAHSAEERRMVRELAVYQEEHSANLPAKTPEARQAEALQIPRAMPTAPPGAWASQ